MTKIRPIRMTAVVGMAALLLAACMRQSPPPAVEVASDSHSSELDWARAALQRNPTLEVVATDTDAGVFTVRLKDSGEVRTLELSDLAAVPVASLSAPAPAAAPSSELHAAAQPSAQPPAATPGPAETAETIATPSYTIERTDGQVKVSGPGVSIVSTGATTVTPARAASEQRQDPLICEGHRLLHLDNRNIDAHGDAIVARGGCELYITNSRIGASGTGVVVMDAIVHIANSTIEGRTASFEARETAKLYIRSSTLRGVARRAEGAVVQDQGGNRWQ